MLMPEPVRYQNKGTQSGTGLILQDAGMPMPAASTSMPMPSYAAALTAASNTAAGPALGLFLTTGAALPLPAHAVIRSNVLQNG
jgi:hypothetical protein